MNPHCPQVKSLNCPLINKQSYLKIDSTFLSLSNLIQMSLIKPTHFSAEQEECNPSVGIKMIKIGVRCVVCVQSAVLTILLVEPPQLDLISFVLGLLLQPAGPGKRKNKAPSFSGLGNSVLVFPFSTRSTCYRACGFTLKAAGERRVEDVFPNCEGD